jgi:hypothetical protein
MMRPAIDWYQGDLDRIKDHIKKELDKDNLINVSRIDSFPVLSQQFDKAAPSTSRGTKRSGEDDINLTPSKK